MLENCLSCILAKSSKSGWMWMFVVSLERRNNLTFLQMSVCVCVCVWKGVQYCAYVCDYLLTNFMEKREQWTHFVCALLKRWTIHPGEGIAWIYCIISSRPSNGTPIHAWWVCVCVAGTKRPAISPFFLLPTFSPPVYTVYVCWITFRLSIFSQ